MAATPRKDTEDRAEKTAHIKRRLEDLQTDLLSRSSKHGSNSPPLDPHSGSSHRAHQSPPLPSASACRKRELPKALKLGTSDYCNGIDTVNCCDALDGLSSQKVLAIWQKLEEHDGSKDDATEDHTERIVDSLRGLNPSESRILLETAFRRYEPGTPQREILKKYMVPPTSKERVPWCELLIFECRAYRTSDNKFLAENGGAFQIPVREEYSQMDVRTRMAPFRLARYPQKIAKLGSLGTRK